VKRGNLFTPPSPNSAGRSPRENHFIIMPILQPPSDDLPCPAADQWPSDAECSYLRDGLQSAETSENQVKQTENNTMNKFSKFPADVICELHPLFKGLLWVSAAKSTDETRYVLCNVLVEREGLECHIVATDGRRMHIHTFDPGMFDDDIQMIEPGLYEVITKTGKLIVIAPSECGSTYPNWRNIIPDHKPENEDVFESRSISKMAIRTGVLLATDFVTDAIGFGHGRKKDQSTMVRYGTPEKSGAFVIEHDLGKAIVMPLRMDDGEYKTEEKPKTDAENTPDLPGIAELEAVEPEKPKRAKKAKP